MLPESEPSERTTTVLKLTEGLGLTEVGIKISEDIDWNDQSCNIWAGNCEGACFIRGDSEGEEVSVWPDFSVCFLKFIFRDSFIAKYTVGYWR